MSEPLIPMRTSLVGECVRVVRARIEGGEWADKLPGERRIAEQLQVGRDTVRLALRQMETEGLISSAAKGSRREVLLKAGGSKVDPGKALRVGMLSIWNLERLPQPMLLEVDRIRTALAQQGGTLEVFAPAWYRSERPRKRLEELLREVSCQAWILHRSSAAIQRCMEKVGVPCLIRGYPHEGIGLPHLDVDWRATARHGAGTLWRLGHRRVAVLTSPDLLQGVAAAIEGVQTLGEQDFHVRVLEEDGTAEGLGRVLARALQAESPPTALIAIRPRQATTAFTWLLSHGWLVPRDVSVLSLGYEPFLDHLVPAPSGYWVSPEMVARRLVRRIEALCHGQLHSSSSPWITPEFRKGASIGPAKEC